MKKEIKAVICVILALWLFFVGFEVGSIREKKLINEELSASAAQNMSTVPQTTTTVPSSSETTIAANETTTQGSETTAANQISQTQQAGETTTKKSSADPSSLSKEEILSKVTDAFNKLRAEQNLTAKKTESVTVQLTSLSVESARNFVNKIIQKLVGDETETYTFTGGVGSGTDADGKPVENVTVAAVIPPYDGFKLTVDGISTASAEKSGDNTVYTIKLVEESTTFTAPVPTHNSVAYSYLDLTKIDISGATITDANMHYPGTTITVTVNADEKITNLHFNMPMDGNGAAKLLAFNGNASFEGADDEVWDITY